MNMTAGRRALDKIYKRRDRYEISEWQRGEVWNEERKQQLIDSILRGWKLPKFYFVKWEEDEYEVVDGPQRLAAIYEFFANELPISEETTKQFGGPHYKDLKQHFSDAFDDFEIEYDEIEDATEEELKQFFQRLQQGLPLTSSEKLNSVHSKLRDFAKSLVTHDFFTRSIVAANTRLSHFDIVSKIAAIEIEGIDTGLRFDDIRDIFEAQVQFSSESAVAQRILGALNFLARAFQSREPSLKNRTIIQSVVTFTTCLIETRKSAGLEPKIADFVRHFMSELAHQVELGQAATDYDYIRFQKSVNANVRAGPRIRQEILLRKAFMFESSLADAFDPSALVASGISGRVKELADSIAAHVNRINSGYSTVHGEDLFKATNKTTQAMLNIGKSVKDVADYEKFIDHLYFLCHEGPGQRLSGKMPQSFRDVTALRTDLNHDVDHGDQVKIKAKRKSVGAIFEKYAGIKSPQLLDASRFILVQANLLSAIELDLTNLVVHLSRIDG